MTGGQVGDLRRDEWAVAQVPSHDEAVAFLSAIHYARGAGNTATYRHGLYRPGPLFYGDLWGVALWIPPTRTAAETVDENWQGVLCLSRLAVHPEAPRNAASFLLAASRRRIDRQRWPTLLTYADTALGHTGAIYRADNWEYLGAVKAGDTWLGPGGEQRGRKRGGHNRTVVEMEAEGFVRREAAPKLKFVRRNGR